MGFQKLNDNISLQQLLSGLVKKNGDRLDYGTGLSKPTLLKALRDLQDKGIIAAIHRSSTERGDEATNYRLCYADGVQPLVCQKRAPEVAQREPVGWRHPDSPPDKESLPGGWSKKFTRGVVKKSRPQYTEEQETESRAITLVFNNSSASPFVDGVVLSDEDFWAATHQPGEEPVLERDTGSEPSCLALSPHPNSGAPLSPTGERRQTGASALIAVGMTAKVAYRLAEHYSLERIEEKLRYLDFLQQHRPDKVKNPCGWLRTAIEDDFAAPDGYHSSADDDQQLVATLALADALLEPPEPMDSPPKERVIAEPQAHYGTTEADRTLWQQVLTDLKVLGRSYLYDLLADAYILQVTDEKALIGVQSAVSYPLLQHPQNHMLLSRTLTQLAGRPLVPEFVPLRE